MNTTFRVSTTRGDRVLTEGIIDKNARFVFTHGYCTALAFALAERTGGLVAQIDPLDPRMSEYSLHAGVVIGEQTARLAQFTQETPLRDRDVADLEVIDIDGRHGLLDWRDRWVVPGRTRMVIAGTVDVDDEKLADIEHCRAWAFAATLLERVAAEFEEAK